MSRCQLSENWGNQYETGRLPACLYSMTRTAASAGGGQGLSVPGMAGDEGGSVTISTSRFRSRNGSFQTLTNTRTTLPMTEHRQHGASSETRPPSAETGSCLRVHNGNLANRRTPGRSKSHFCHLHAAEADPSNTQKNIGNSSPVD